MNSGIRIAASHGRLALAAVLSLLWSTAGCSRNGLPDERNPYYQRGLKFLEQKKANEAAEAFEKALRLSPSSAKPNLQLGRLYEDDFADPATAIYHFRCYLKKRPDDPNAEALQRWLERAEKAYLSDLLSRYGTVETNGATVGVAGGQMPASDREKVLAEQVRQLTAEVAALRQPVGGTTVPSRGTTPGTASAPTGRPKPSTTVPPKASAAARTHAVVVGDTLSAISRKYYGSTRYWPDVRDANHDVLRGGDRLTPGMHLEIPPLEQLKSPAKTANPNAAKIP